MNRKLLSCPVRTLLLACFFILTCYTVRAGATQQSYSGENLVSANAQAQVSVPMQNRLYFSGASTFVVTDNGDLVGW